MRARSGLRPSGREHAGAAKRPAQASQKSGGNENSDRSMHGHAGFIAPAFLSAYQNSQDYFLDDPGGGSALLSDLFPHR